MRLFELFKAFFKIGAILLGGGYVIVPVISEELIEKRGWLTHDELVDYYCIAQCLPGIVAINTSILVGYKLAKFKGVLISVFALTLSPFISIVLIAKFLSAISHIPFIESVFWGVNISVIVLIYLALKEMWEVSFVDKLSYIWFFIILFLSFKVSPVILIILSVIFGVVLHFIRTRKNA